MKALQMSKSSKAVKAGPLDPFKAGSSEAIEDTFDSTDAKRGNLLRKEFGANRADLRLRKSTQKILSWQKI